MFWGFGKDLAQGAGAVMTENVEHFHHWSVSDSSNPRHRVKRTCPKYREILNGFLRSQLQLHLAQQ